MELNVLQGILPILVVVVLTIDNATSINTDCNSTGVYLNVDGLTIGNVDYIGTPGDGDYPSNQDCRWFLYSNNSNVNIQVKFVNTYDIEFNKYCSYDRVTLYHGIQTSRIVDTNTINRVCGSDMPPHVYTSSGNSMTITFDSDYTIEKGGFELEYTFVSALKNECFALRTEFDAMYRLTWDYIYFNETYISNIATPLYNSRYESNIEVYWLITRNPNNATDYDIILEITDIRIERSYNCIYDRLVIYDGPCVSDPEKDRLCSNWEKTYSLNGYAFLINFHSDNYYEYSGISMDYYEIPKADVAITTTTTTAGPPVGAVVEAIKEALVNYTDDVLPNRDLSEAIVVSVDFYLVGINGLDEVEQMLTSTIAFEVNWMDPSLVWEPTKRNGIVQLLMPQDDLWKPDIALLNGFSKITAMGASFMFIDINYNGSAIWKPYQILESTCQVDMTHYPHERQTCTLQFGTWSSSDNEIVTELGANGLQKHRTFQENAEWSLIGFRTVESTNTVHTSVEFRVTIQRNARYVTYYLTIPTVMLAFLNVLTFLVPTESGEKSGYSITIFLSFVVVLIVINDTMPENSDSISLYAAYALAMTIFSGVALILTVLQIRALTLDETRYPIGERAQKIVGFIIRIRDKVTCSKEQAKPDQVDTETEYSDVDTQSEKAVSEVSDDDQVPVEEDRFVMPRQWKLAPNKLSQGVSAIRPLSRGDTTFYNSKFRLTRQVTTESIALEHGNGEIMNMDPVDPEYENVIAPSGSVIEVVSIVSNNTNTSDQTPKTLKENKTESHTFQNKSNEFKEKPQNDTINDTNLKDDKVNRQIQGTNNELKMTTVESPQGIIRRSKVSLRDEHHSSQGNIDDKTETIEKHTKSVNKTGGSRTSSRISLRAIDKQSFNITAGNIAGSIKSLRSEGRQSRGENANTQNNRELQKDIDIQVENKADSNAKKTHVAREHSDKEEDNEFNTNERAYTQQSTDTVDNSDNDQLPMCASPPKSDMSEDNTLNNSQINIIKVSEQGSTVTTEDTMDTKVLQRKWSRSVSFVSQVDPESPSLGRSATNIGASGRVSIGSAGPVSRSEGFHGRSVIFKTTNEIEMKQIRSNVPYSADIKKLQAKRNADLRRKVSFTDEKKTVDVNSSEEENIETYAESEVSEDSSMSNKSKEDDSIKWADIVSCLDIVFFIVYLIITLILTLALFLTMFTKGDDEVP